MVDSKLNSRYLHSAFMHFYNFTIVRDYFLTPVRMANIQKTRTTNAGENAEKGEPSYTVGGNLN